MTKKTEESNVKFQKAARDIDYKAMQVALDEGADINSIYEKSWNFTNWKYTALEWAAYYTYTKLAKFLIDHNADVNKGHPLYTAIGRCDDTQILSLFLDNGAELGTNDSTMLHEASSTGNDKSILFFLKRGSDVNAIDKQGATPLYVYCSGLNGYNSHGLHHYIDYGANVNLANNNRQTPLHMAAITEGLNAVITLVDAGANFDSPDKNGNTSLHLAAKASKLKNVKQLLEFGADRSQCNNMSQTPAEIASDEKVHEFIKNYNSSTLYLKGEESGLNNSGGGSSFFKQVTDFEDYTDSEESSGSKSLSGKSLA